MMGKNKIYCWQIMQCDDETICPVRQRKIEACWEWMAENAGFQNQCGLCDDCIIYLCKNKLFSFSNRDLEQIMTWRTTTIKKENTVSI